MQRGVRGQLDVQRHGATGHWAVVAVVNADAVGIAGKRVVGLGLLPHVQIGQVGNNLDGYLLVVISQIVAPAAGANVHRVLERCPRGKRVAKHHEKVDLAAGRHGAQFHVTWSGATTGATPSVAVTNEVPAGSVSVSNTFAAGMSPRFR